MFNRLIKSKTEILQAVGKKEPEKISRVIPKEKVRFLADSVATGAIHSGKGDKINALRKKTATIPAIVSAVTGSGSDESTAALEVSKIVEDRLKEFEARHQYEKEQASNDAYNRGKLAGMADARKDIENIEAILTKMNTDLSLEWQKLIAQANTVLARLAVEIAETIIGEAAMKASNEMLEYNLKRCLDVLGGSGKVIVRVNPTDFQFARDNLNIAREMSKDGFSFEFESDQSITPGGCFLESRNGAIDARVEKQFQAVKDNFLQLA